MYSGPYWALVYEKAGLSITPDFRALLLAIFVFFDFSVGSTDSIGPTEKNIFLQSWQMDSPAKDM